MHEEDGESGITHFIEHALIRNVNKLEGGKMYSRLDKLGIEFNAGTYSEMVQFYTGGSVGHFGFAADMITKLLSPIVLNAGEIDAERRRIKAEIRENDDKTSLSTFSPSNISPARKKSEIPKLCSDGFLYEYILTPQRHS